MSKRERSRPAIPYRKPSIPRILGAANQRLAGCRGPRAWNALTVLVTRLPQVQSGRLYLGDSCTDHGREHASERCCMAKLMRRCGKTAHRAKYDLVRVGLIQLFDAGPGVKAGGKTLDRQGKAVGRATGYQLDPSLFNPAPVHQAASTVIVGAVGLEREKQIEQQGLADALHRWKAAQKSRGGGP